MTDDTLAVGDVVQIDPTIQDSFFGGLFGLVTETKAFGAVLEFTLPSETRGATPVAAYVRMEHKWMTRIGRAVWLPMHAGG